jgi:predicted nucleic acid-binding protein
VVVDSSVVVKWFVDEPERSAALDLLRAEQPLVAPDLLLIEVAHTLRRKVGEGRLPGPAATAALTEVMDGPVELVPTAPLSLRAMRLADRAGGSVYDACFVALAEERGAPLVTADERLARTVRMSGLDVEVRTLR